MYQVVRVCVCRHQRYMHGHTSMHKSSCLCTKGTCIAKLPVRIHGCVEEFMTVSVRACAWTCVSARVSVNACIYVGVDVRENRCVIQSRTLLSLNLVLEDK